MARELVQIDIDGKSYEFTQFNTTQSLKMLSRLTNLIGETALLTMAAGYNDSKTKTGKKTKGFLDAELDKDLVAKAIKELVSRMGDDDEVVEIIKELACKGILCDHKQIVFDSHYEGSEGLAHLFKVVKAALGVQYGNFIGVLTESVSTLSQKPSKGIVSV